jgi:acyl-CoA synthetase (NDP forming)
MKNSRLFDKKNIQLKAVGTLFEARSVCIIGASSDPEKLSSSPLKAMELQNFCGKISLVNPKYDELFGKKCYPNVNALPDHIEAAMIVLPAEKGLIAAEECVQRGILSIVMLAQGFGESGPEGLARDKRLQKLCLDYGAAIVGPNTNGLFNIETGLCLSIAPILHYKDRVFLGNVGVISQSGAMISSLLHEMHKSRVGVRKAVACGNELVLSMPNYLVHMCDDEQINTVVLYIETIRDVELFRKALKYATDTKTKVIAIKVGQSEQGQKATLSHTGAIAGSYKNIIALLEYHDVYIADDIRMLASLAECLETFNWGESVGKVYPFITAISGGFAAQCADEAARLGVVLKDPSKACKIQLESLPTQSHGINPYDIAAQNELIPEIVKYFRKDGFNVLIFGLALLKPENYEAVKEKIVSAKEQGMDNIIVICPSVEENDKIFFKSKGIMLHDCATNILKTLFAINRCEENRRWAGGSPYLNDDMPTLNFLPSTNLLNEAKSKEILNALGFKTPRHIVADANKSRPKILDLTYPLVIKGLSDKVAHKTEQGLIALELRDAKAIDAAWDRISGALAKADPDASQILIEEYVSSGLEAILGIYRDSAVGPVVVMGAGGILCELVDDNIIMVPPFSAERARHAILKTKFGRLCDGFRGKKYDLNALSNAASKLGDVALHYPQFQSIDINPILIQAGSGGLIAVDANILLN